MERGHGNAICPDLSLLVNSLLGHVNAKAKGEPGFKEKKLSPSAKNLLLQHGWPGNVRELLNTLQRAAVWTDDEVISVDAARAALLDGPAQPIGSDGILHRPIDEGVDLEGILKEVARHYLGRAVEASQGNKTQAAKLVGFSSYQTLTNWLKKYGL